MWSSVDLPEPLGPITHTSSRGPTERSTPFRMDTFCPSCSWMREIPLASTRFAVMGSRTVSGRDRRARTAGAPHDLAARLRAGRAHGPERPAPARAGGGPRAARAENPDRQHPQGVRQDAPEVHALRLQPDDGRRRRLSYPAIARSEPPDEVEDAALRLRDLRAVEHDVDVEAGLEDGALAVIGLLDPVIAAERREAAPPSVHRDDERTQLGTSPELHDLADELRVPLHVPESA